MLPVATTTRLIQSFLCSKMEWNSGDYLHAFAVTTGVENFYVGQYMIEHRGEGRGSIITGSSVHNSRVERAYRDIYSGVLAFYARIFKAMEDKSILDISDEVHLFSLHHIYIPRINRSLEEFIQQMNNHPVSTENNQSSLQMWERESNME